MRRWRPTDELHPGGLRPGAKIIAAPAFDARPDQPRQITALRAQLLGLLSQPASMFVRVINAVPQGIVNVLQAKVRAAEGNK